VERPLDTADIGTLTSAVTAGSRFGQSLECWVTRRR
jgi:hypothetical protein